MKITFLGTGTSQGIPVIACKCNTCLSKSKYDKRLRSSVLIELNNKNILIDAGPDFRQQMLKYKVVKLDAILITHEHRDHIAGLDDIRSYNWIYKKPVDVYAEKRVIDLIKTQYSYVFSEEKYPGVPEMNLIEISESPFFINDIKIIPVRYFHFKLPILGYRINDFAYITDISNINNEELEKLKNLNVLVVSALRKKPHISHFNLNAAINFIKLLSPKIAYLTHISHLMGKHKDISKELKKKYNLHIKLAYDGLIINI
ncbi:MAG: MBL fold metallo-hydrolase [Bacteroidales bacterium]|nr:MBL fold metallo-hydrolase [Bacteroidales bacterium]